MVQTPGSRHEISRLEAFSDAVFGFALALLVVSANPPSSYAELMDRMAGGVSFACCFALLVWIWYEHNSFFRRFGMRDGYTILINSVLLFVILLYVYPLKFMFDSAFARMLPRLSPPQPMRLYELANASAVYAVGFIVIFSLFALLYWRAYANRAVLGLSELDAFDATSSMGHHLVSVAVGVLSFLVAASAPLWLAPIAPMVYIVMGPFHYVYGLRRGWAREAEAMQLASGALSAKSASR